MTFRLVPAKKAGLSLVDGQGQSRSSRIDPVQEGRRAVESMAPDPGDFIVVLGLAPIYHLTPLMTLLKDPLRQVVCLETDGDLRACAPDLWKEIGGGEPLPTVLGPAEGAKVLSMLDESRIKPRHLKILQSNRNPADGYDGILSQLKGWVSDRLKAETTEIAFSKRWTRNARRNATRKGLRWLSEAPRQQGPAVLVSSGPGLEADADALGRLASEMSVYSLPGPSAILGKMGIPITAFISTDGGYWNLAHFEAAKRWHPGARLFAPLSIYGAIPARYDDAYFFFDDEDVARDWPARDLVARNWIPQAGTAVNAALTVLQKLGHSSILTSGIEFALTPWRCHAPGNITEERFFCENRRLKPFETLYHRAFGMAFTSHPFKPGAWVDEKLDLYRRLYRDQAGHLGIPVNPLKS